MEAIKDQVGFEGTLREFFSFLRDDPQFFFPTTDEGRAAYLQMSRDYLGAITEAVPRYFGLVPKAELIVRRVEAFRSNPARPSTTPKGLRTGRVPAPITCT